jgi:hypothetical protein
MTYKYNAISLLFMMPPAFFNLCARYIMEGRDQSIEMDANYCLDAPNYMPAGGCQAFEAFGRKGANFAEQIEVTRP